MTTELNGPKRATLSVVARAAGVSTATVSKVLNNRSDVSAETRRRVEVALNDHAYQPTTGPRAASAARSVTALFDTLENIYSTQVLRGLLEAAAAIGVDIVVEEIGGVDGMARVYGTGLPLSPSWVQSLVRKGRLGVLAVT